MVSDGMILYNNYRLLVTGALFWEELSRETQNTWEKLANQLFKEGWRPVV